MIVLALGSNLGSRLDNLITASKMLPLRNRKYSYVYESKALLPENAPLNWDIPFLNMAISGYTHLSPTELLTSIKDIEKSLGRRNMGVWAPRPIDIDILFYGRSSIQDTTLTIPHKRIHERDFVLVPACDICARFSHSTLEVTLESLLLNMDSDVVKKCKLPLGI
ncbi:2-amino-4-hydroxy-6-hydroxymethyldihydropteridine diphosphokinase [Anaplasma bovis]|uniref:2-amino-4-hydroxy-6- hydroxymethyldihydropteridine diphosphokinase n=1 Tax=Anaplasma bovis TaxID=186733 RepID=UPI002FF2DAFB